MLAFRCGFEYRKSDLEVIKSAIFATFYAILVKIGSTNPKISQGVSVLFGMKWQKLIYHTNYLSKYWTELYQIISIGSHMYADYKTEIIFAVVEETWQTSKLTVFTLWFGISKQNGTSFSKCAD